MTRLKELTSSFNEAARLMEQLRDFVVRTSLEVRWSDTPLYALSQYAGLLGIGCAMADFAGDAIDVAPIYDACHIMLTVTQERLRSPSALGKSEFLGGAAGILLCADAIAKQCPGIGAADWLQEAATTHIRSVVIKDSQIDDISRGIAGAICGIVWLSSRFGMQAHEEISRLAETLVTHLRRATHGIVYRKGIPAVGPISGLAHGVAGVAVALLEASIALKEEKLYALAVEMMNFEFDAQYPTNLWPEVRFDAVEVVKIEDPIDMKQPTTGNSWCYGTSGMCEVLRLFYDRTLDPVWRTRHERLRAVCARRAAKTPALRLGDHCLCHGTASRVAFLPGKSKVREFEEQLLRDMALTYQTIFANILKNPEGELPRLFPTGRQTDHSTIATRSYFVGLAGVMATYRRAIEGKFQNHLLLPYSI